MADTTYVNYYAPKTLTVGGVDCSGTFPSAGITISAERAPIFIEENLAAVKNPLVQRSGAASVIFARPENVVLKVAFGEPDASLQSPYLSIDNADRGEMTFVLVTADDTFGTNKHLEVNAPKCLPSGDTTITLARREAAQIPVNFDFVADSAGFLCTFGEIADS